MMSRSLTITVNSYGPVKYPYYATIIAERGDVWLGVSFGESPKIALSKALKYIIDSVNNPNYHIWRDWD